MKTSHPTKMLPGLAVEIKNSWQFEKAFRQFNKMVQDSGILKELKDRMYFESKPAKKHRRAKMARARWLRKAAESDPRTPIQGRKKPVV